MVKYRIKKQNYVTYDPLLPYEEKQYVIQRKGFFMWLNMHFDDYAESIMCFRHLEAAQLYLKRLKRIK